MRFLVAPIVFLWPGFRGVARYGLWSQLAIALVFGFLCQATLALNFLWSDFFSSFFHTLLRVFLLVSWILLNVVASVRLKSYKKMRASDSTGEAFLEAQTHYLKGNLFETECCLKALLKKNPYDSDALLFLATLYRHMGRYADARRYLAEMEKLDSSYRWQNEIAVEKNIIKEKELEEKESRNLSSESLLGESEQTAEVGDEQDEREDKDTTETFSERAA